MVLHWAKLNSLFSLIKLPLKNNTICRDEVTPLKLILLVCQDGLVHTAYFSKQKQDSNNGHLQTTDTFHVLNSIATLNSFRSNKWTESHIFHILLAPCLVLYFKYSNFGHSYNTLSPFCSQTSLIPTF